MQNKHLTRRTKVQWKVHRLKSYNLTGSIEIINIIINKWDHQSINTMLPIPQISTTVKTLVHAFISSRLDYCNTLLYGVNDGLLKKLQAVQNAAARVTTETRKFDHITPILRELHWLPVRKRIVYKLAVTVYKCLHGLAPPYLAVDCVPVTSLPSRRHLKSAESGCLAITGARTTLGSRIFAVAEAKIWNGTVCL